MYHPDRPLFGDGPNMVMHATLYPRDDGYVDLVIVISPRVGTDILERSTYARLTSEEALDVWYAQLRLLLVAESPS